MIKQPILFFISLILLAAALYFGATRLIFVMRSEKAIGIVSDFSSSNGRCGSKNNKYDCTNFYAKLKFQTKTGSEEELSVSAGNSRGHNQSTKYADYSLGAQVPVLYNPSDPKTAYRDSTFDIWGIPLMLFGGQLLTLFGSFCRSKSRRRFW